MAKFKNVSKNITRNFERKSVVLRFRRRGRSRQETFALSDYDNSWEKAEQAAKLRRETLIKELPDPANGRHGVMTNHNNSGAVGVHFQHHRTVSSSGNINNYPIFCATWSVGSKRVSTSWFISKYGFKEAFVLAVLSREMESSDRKEILSKFEEIQHTKRFKQIADQCALEWE